MPTPRIENLDTSRIANIMSVALEEFSQADYQSSSFNRIIKNSGISKGTMYYYFKSKEDVFLTLLSGIRTEFKSFSLFHFDEITSKEDYWERVQKILTYVLSELQQKQSLGSFLCSLLSFESRKKLSPARELLDEVEDWINEAIVTGQLLDAVRRDQPIELLVKGVWSVWDTALEWMGKPQGVSDLKEWDNILNTNLKRLLQS